MLLFDLKKRNDLFLVGSRFIAEKFKDPSVLGDNSDWDFAADHRNKELQSYLISRGFRDIKKRPRGEGPSEYGSSYTFTIEDVLILESRNRKFQVSFKRNLQKTLAFWGACTPEMYKGLISKRHRSGKTTEKVRRENTKILFRIVEESFFYEEEVSESNYGRL